MKKILFCMMIGLVGLSACSNDDDDKKSKLNKLTKVTCYVNDETTPLYQVEIVYKSNDGKISHIQTSDKGKLNYIFYHDKTLTVSGSGAESTEYILNNNFITQKKTQILHPVEPSATYINEEYSYSYKRNKLNSADKLVRWPSGNGISYETRQYPDYNSYTWTGNDITLFAQDTREMVYEYMLEKRPDNLPFMIPNSFRPRGFEIVDPTNFMWGALNEHLVSYAYWYTVPDAAAVCAEYLFDYTIQNEYVTAIRIEEKNHLADGGGYNTYRINLEYTYQEK